MANDDAELDDVSFDLLTRWVLTTWAVFQFNDLATAIFRDPQRAAIRDGHALPGHTEFWWFRATGPGDLFGLSHAGSKFGERVPNATSPTGVSLDYWGYHGQLLMAVNDVGILVRHISVPRLATSLQRGLTSLLEGALTRLERGARWHDVGELTTSDRGSLLWGAAALGVTGGTVGGA